VVLVEEGDDALIEACRFAGGKWDDQNKRGGSGLWVKAQSFAVVKSCIAEGNDRCGMEAAEQARPTLEENQCRYNKAGGIAYFGNSGGTAGARFAKGIQRVRFGSRAPRGQC
jgi:parallel beta-helix repeat protein